ncbi:MAG: signal peptide peptidase SppA [Myxococcales bacterium]|nr:MAG: signal peptide peptidase SppA [Myxococcales bacterium]
MSRLWENLASKDEHAKAGIPVVAVGFSLGGVRYSAAERVSLGVCNCEMRCQLPLPEVCQSMRFISLSLVGLLFLFVPSHHVFAQFARSVPLVEAPPVSITGVDDALAVDVNPALLSFLPAWSLVYVHMDGSNRSDFATRGDAFYAAMPLPFGFALGASAQSLRPTDASFAPNGGAGSLALSFSPARTMAVGTAFRFISSDSALLDNVTTVDASMVWRPSTWLGFSLIGRDLTSPENLARSYVFATGIRPLGDRSLGIEVAATTDDDARVGLRGVLDTAIPYFGRFQVAAEGKRLSDVDREWLLTGGLVFQWGHASFAAGALYGDGFNERPGWYIMERLEGAERPGPAMAMDSFVIDVEVEGGLSERKMLSTLHNLDALRFDKRVQGVMLRFRSSGLGQADAQEFRLAVMALRAAGKKVLCHLDAASGSEFYACKGADAIWLDPAGGIRLVGPSLRFLHIAELMEKVGVRADFEKIGRYKSAPEMLQSNSMSDAAREQREALLSDVYQRFLVDVAKDSHLETAKIRQWVDNGPYLSTEASEAGLVDALTDEMDMNPLLEKQFDGLPVLRDSLPVEHEKHWGVPPRIGVVVIDGDIIDGQNVDIPFVNIHMSGSRSVRKTIENFANDPSIRAIVVRINSPGGSAMASDQIWRALKRAKERKPVIASLGAVAASGGYYVASVADEIWADPSTVTGSIGVFFGKVDIAPLAERLGIHVELLGRGKRHGVESMWRPFSDEERAMLRDKIQKWYAMFVARVAAGRGLSEKKVDSLARGRIWSGDAAMRHGLVDRLGGYIGAISRARELAGLSDDAEVVLRPERPSSLLDYVLGTGQSTDASVAEALLQMSPEMRGLVQMVAAMQQLPPGVALARLPWISSEDL